MSLTMSFLKKAKFLLVFVPILLFTFPTKSYAFFCPAFLCLDPIQDVEGGATVVTTGVSAGANTISTALQGSLWAKTFVGDALANALAKSMIRSLTAQTVKWINSGFKGNPAYVTDPANFFQNTGDQAASFVLSNNGVLSKLCSPWKAQVRLSIAKSYVDYTNPSYSCSLGQIEQNYNTFVNNFSQGGGWDTWFQVTQNSNNNPFGAYLTAETSLESHVNSNIQKYTDQINRGNGFLSYERCKPGKKTDLKNKVSNVDQNQCLSWDGSSGKQVCTEYKSVDIDTGLGDGECSPNDKEVVTPGSVIKDQLSNVIKSPVAQLELTNSINQVVSALMIQMVQQVVGGIGNGLKGLSESGSATSGSSYGTLLEQMVAGTQTVQKSAPVNGGAEDAKTVAGIKNTSDANQPGSSAFCASNPTNPTCSGLGIPTESEIKAKNKNEQNILSGEYCASNPTDPECISGQNLGSGGSVTNP